MSEHHNMRATHAIWRCCNDHVANGQISYTLACAWRDRTSLQRLDLQSKNRLGNEGSRDTQTCHTNLGSIRLSYCQQQWMMIIIFVTIVSNDLFYSKVVILAY